MTAPTRRWPRSTAGLVVLLALCLLPACGPEPSAFRVDDRVEVVAPAEGATIAFPAKIRWQVRTPDVLPRGGAFVVVVDRPPQPPGRGLEHYVAGDSKCGGTAVSACVQAEELALRRVFRSTETSVTIEFLPVRADQPPAEQHRHEFTIVVVDAQGQRVGEANWFGTFFTG